MKRRMAHDRPAPIVPKDPEPDEGGAMRRFWNWLLEGLCVVLAGRTPYHSEERR